LTYICNKSISAGVFLEHLKYSIIIPLYKKGDKTNPINYRPISLLTSFSKVFEKALYMRLFKHINNNNILVEQQYGFRKGLATEDSMFKMTHQILDALNNKEMVGSIFCDLEKAFDSVNHSLLLKKTPILWYNRQV
jgi:retron-type reverse transcriptase